MTGIDDLIDEEDDKQEQEEAEGILDELGVDSKEELEALEQKLDRVQHGLAHYDKRMEELEEEVKLQRSIISRLIGQIHELSDSNSSNEWELETEQQDSTDDSGDSSSGLEW